ncbi:MAG TPA: hypothetical protein GXX20_01765 [Clostridiaceae bacterium]|nr:hypothetical protein [Clostridiaceae bacterium]
MRRNSDRFIHNIIYSNSSAGKNAEITDTAYLQKQLRKYKIRFFRVLFLFLAFLILVSVYIYLNYDYLVFKHLIAQNYIYTEALDQLYKEELKRDINGKYYSFFDNLVISTMTKKIRELNNDRYTYQYIPEQYQQYKLEEMETAALSEIQELNDTTVLLRLTNFSSYTEKFMKNNYSILKKYPNIIIDLRDNYGGDINVMARISDLFLPKGSIIATDKMRLFNRVYKAKTAKTLEYENIIILQNKNTASASENMIVALNENLNNVTLIGEKTFGKGIGQFTLPLRRGFAVKATVLLWYGPEGNNIHGYGIEPHIEYAGDDIIEFALSKIS